MEAEERPAAVREGYDIASLPLSVFELGADVALFRLNEDWWFVTCGWRPV